MQVETDSECESEAEAISHKQQLRRTLIEYKNQPSTSTGTFTTPQIIRSHSVNGDTSQNEQLQQTSKEHNNQPFSSATFASPEMIRPHPKAGPRTSTKGRKRATTKILIATPEKLALEAEVKAKKEKKLEKEQRAKIRALKRITKQKLKDLRESSSSGGSDIILPSSESEYDPNDEMQVETDSECESEAEDDEFELSVQDWVIVSFVSERNLVHRYDDVNEIFDPSYIIYPFNRIQEFHTDISEGKSSWLAIQAYNRGTSAQKKLLEENYGKNNKESIQKCYELFEDLKLKEVFLNYKEEFYNATFLKIHKEVPKILPKELFVDLLNWSMTEKP
uniref:Uncharacterized protein LOC114344570 n=1 Tax=Diabrotica virgifera virgifera TaxID=50390 RepID=A0A6P7H5F1_DIAVI